MKSDATLLNQKLELIQWLSTIEDSSLIKKIMELRKKEASDWWNSISEKKKNPLI